MFEFISEMGGDWLGRVVLLLLLTVVVVAVWPIVYGLTCWLTPYGPEFIVSARVKAVNYVGSTTSTGVGPTINGSVAITTSTSSEQYNVVLIIGDKTPCIVDQESLFNDVEPGNKLNLTIKSKRVFGSNHWNLVSWQHVR